MNVNTISVIRTGDGSPSLYNHVLQEPYHSRHGALAESMHVFIAAGLNNVLQQGCKEIQVLEVGLGTGLNAQLAISWAMQHQVGLRYLGTEPFPPSEALLEEYYTSFSAEQFVHRETLYALPGEWRKLQGDTIFCWEHKPVQEVEFPGCDVIFMDAFAPEKAPDLWTDATLAHLFAQTRKGGVLVSYCAQGQFRRALLRAGWMVEKLPGPPGKREMTRAIKE